MKAFDYSGLRLCVGGEGRSRRIQGGQGGQIPQEENVETEAETWETQEPTLQPLAAAGGNCCLETKTALLTLFPPSLLFRSFSSGS